MAFGQNLRFDLSSFHNVARYCSRRRIDSNGLPLEEAFLLRPNEEYISTNWFEHFHPSDRPVQLTGVRQTLTGKGREVRPSASFAVLNTGASVTGCKDKLNVDLRFTVLGETSDPSHTGIYGLLPLDEEVRDLVSTLLAKSVRPNEVYPATQ